MADGLKSKVQTSLGWSMGAKFGTQLISWAGTIIVIRFLHPDDYGLVAMAGVFVALCLLLNELGLSAAIIQTKEVTDRLLRQVFGLVLLVNMFIFILLILATNFMAEFYDEKKLLEIVPVLALQFLITSFSAIPNALLIREMNFRAVSIVDIVSALSSSAVTFTMAWFGYGLWSLIYGSLAGIVVRAVGLNIYSPYLKIPTLNLKGFGKEARFGIQITLQKLLWYVYTQADILLIGKVLGKTSLGYYSVSMDLATLPMQKVGSILHAVGLPAYSKLRDEPQLAGQYVVKASRAIAFVAFPVFFGISAIAPELISVVLGDKWLPAILPLQLLSIVVPLRTVQISLAPAVSGMGRPDVIVRTLIVACIVMPLAFAYGLRWDLAGVSIAWVVSYSLWFLFMLTKVLPVFALSMKEFLASLAGPAFYSAIMLGIVFLVRVWLNQFQLLQFVVLILLVLSGIVVYSCGMILFCRKTCNEVWSLLKK